MVRGQPETLLLLQERLLDCAFTSLDFHAFVGMLVSFRFGSSQKSTLSLRRRVFG